MDRKMGRIPTGDSRFVKVDNIDRDLWVVVCYKSSSWAT